MCGCNLGFQSPEASRLIHAPLVIERSNIYANKLSMAVNVSLTRNPFCPVSDAPVCISSSVTIVGASIDESVAIPCRISADPSKVSFEWTFSNSGERYEVPSGHYTTIQNFHTDTDHVYIDANEAGANGNGTLISLLLLLPYFFPAVSKPTALIFFTSLIAAIYF